jgi:D-3-phosphoglycerate dehydrogenase
MTMAYKILIPQDVSETGKAYLRDRGYEIKMGSGISFETLQNEVRDCHGILARTARYPAEVLRAGPHLKVIGRHGVGVDNIDIAAARHLVQCDAALRSGNFEIRNQMIGNDIEGKVLGLIGVGRVGRLVARKAGIGLSMKVIGFDPFVDPALVPEVEFTETMEGVLKNADFVSLHLPVNEKTMGLIDKARLSMMKPSAYLLNVARGAIVHENDLVEILSEKRIAGAALDVFAEEPPSAANPLFKLDNVTVTPHNAALTRECMDRMAVHAAQGIDEVLSGRTPTWPVNEPKTK